MSIGRNQKLTIFRWRGRVEKRPQISEVAPVKFGNLVKERLRALLGPCRTCSYIISSNPRDDDQSLASASSISNAMRTRWSTILEKDIAKPTSRALEYLPARNHSIVPSSIGPASRHPSITLGRICIGICFRYHLHFEFLHSPIWIHLSGLGLPHAPQYFIDLWHSSQVLNGTGRLILSPQRQTDGHPTPLYRDPCHHTKVANALEFHNVHKLDSFFHFHEPFFN